MLSSSLFPLFDLNLKTAYVSEESSNAYLVHVLDTIAGIQQTVRGGGFNDRVNIAWADSPFRVGTNQRNDAILIFGRYSA